MAPNYVRNFYVLVNESLCIWKECISCHVRIYSTNDRPSWCIVLWCLSSYLYIYCSFLIFLTSAIEEIVVETFSSCYSSVHFSRHSCQICLVHFWGYITVGQCLSVVFYGSGSLLLFISTNIPCPGVKSIEVCLGRQSHWSAWSFCCLFFICFSGCIKYGFT